MEFKISRNRSFIWGGITATVFFIIGIISWISSSNAANFGTFSLLAITGFTLVSCLVLDNNFVGDMIAEIFSWGFVRMPGVIFTLDLDGIIWLLTVKLLFWILGLALAAAAGLLAIVLGLIVSIFVYPFALGKNIREPNYTY